MDSVASRGLPWSPVNYQVDLPKKAYFWPSQNKSAASKLGNLFCLKEFAFNYQLDLPLRANFWLSQKNQPQFQSCSCELQPPDFGARFCLQLSIRFASKGEFLVVPEIIRRQ